MRPHGLMFVGWLGVLSAVLDASVYEGSDDDDFFFAPESVGPSHNLTRYLLSRHNVNAPPDGLIDVYYEMDFVRILGIDELKQTMTALVSVDEKWVDPSLSWDPNDFNGLERTWLPQKAIWLPDIIIFNMLMNVDLLDSGRSPPGTIYYNGTVEIGHPAVYTVSCTINIKRFPLDEQMCAFEVAARGFYLRYEVASWAYGKDKIKLHSHSEHSMEHFSANEEWELINITIQDGEYDHEGIWVCFSCKQEENELISFEVSEIEYQVRVKRKPLFYVVTLIFPSYVMCSISIIGLFARFSTTGEREERFTLGITAILTLAVLSLVVSEKVPHSSTTIPLLVGKFLYNMVIVSLAAMTTGSVMRVHRKGRNGEQPPLWLQHIFFIRNHRPRATYNNDLCNSVELQDLSNNTDSTDCTTASPTTAPPATAHPQVLSNKRDIIGSTTTTPTTSHQHRQTNPVNLFGNRLEEACKAVQAEITRSQQRSRAPRRNRKHGDENGWVKIADRLDSIFMLTYMSLITAPVIYLFANM